MAKILMVDDDGEFLEASKMVLENKGYKVVITQDPQQAFDLVKKENPDLILLDVMMVQADDGIALAQRLRKDGIDKPIVMLSAVGKVTGFEYGKCSSVLPCNDFIEKPISPKDLIKKVQEYI
ncbi:MAG: response regulator [Candidatus Omnitrophica bacterium]|nr:response regulator [Candidatus Omnitrophota bacterium]